MRPSVQARYEARARIIKAMGHPTRLFIVDELAKGERCVNELTEMVGADMSTVSKHLSVLKNVGVIMDEKRGLQVFYRLRTPCIMKFFGCVESVMKTVAEESMAALNSR
ncbi:MAG: metalloregulator ArsR/SmtB family transcription factor [Planctomycetota bacterium]|nr:metalloregulator ArsR/SmtB family transcription factor [Planctomycetota bacterium]